MKKILCFKKAFTLAETLIALVIIGVIAILVIPKVINHVNEMSWSKAKDNFEQKIEEATKQMNIAGVLSKYPTNEAFTDVLQNYIKVAKRCSVSNLDKCFVSTFTTSGGTAINTSSLLTGANLGHSTYTSSLVGLSLINGTNVILAFDPDCAPVEWYDTAGGSYSLSSTSKSFIPGNTTSCLSLLYDINGNKPPNKVGKDIGELNALLNGDDCIQISGLCISSANVSFSPINTCTDTTWDSRLTANTRCENNYWAGAKKACGERGQRLPTIAELRTIWNTMKANTGIRTLMNNSGLSGYYYWASDESGASAAWCKSLKNDNAGTDHKGITWDPARCIK